MDNNKKYKVALVLYTQGIDYDDRIRKEILSIQKIFPNVKFKIFAIDPRNCEEEGITSYGVPYKTLFLKTREKYPSASHIMSKTWEFYKLIKDELNVFDAVWCADPETFLFPLLNRHKPMVWDLHELPNRFMKNPVWRELFRICEKHVRVVIHANKPRLEHLHSMGMIKHPEKQFVLRNYPDFDEIDTEYDDTYLQFERWLGDDKCVYLQGVNTKSRADRESVESVLAIQGLKAVVVGNIRADLKDELLQKHDENEIKERLFFTGRIKQLKTPQYIRKCFMSLVFYKNTSANNWYCEPNRLFQNIINGNPVVVGNNPPMKELVEQYGVGKAVETDGSDIEKVTQGIKWVIDNLSTIKSRLSVNTDNWLWSIQEETIEEIVKRWL